MSDVKVEYHNPDGGRVWTCPKCRNRKVNARWLGDDRERKWKSYPSCRNTEEHFCLTCKTCGYRWDEEVDDE